MSKVNVQPPAPKNVEEKPKAPPRLPAGEPPFVLPPQHVKTPPAAPPPVARSHSATRTSPDKRAAREHSGSSHENKAPQHAPEVSGVVNGLAGVLNLAMAFAPVNGKSSANSDASSGTAPSAGGMDLQEIMGATAPDEMLDCAAVAEILGKYKDDGIFDVSLPPDGERMGVVVSNTPDRKRLSYHLTPASEKLASKLSNKQKQKELKDNLEQHMEGKEVDIIVLC